MQIYRTADLALLQLPATLHIPALGIAEAMPAPGQVLEALGFGSTPTLNSSRVIVRLGGGSRIIDLVQNAATIESLNKQGFPDVHATIINLESQLTPGDSGAPIVDGGGVVVGVANGNLLQGTLPYSWAFPALAIASLVTSTDRALPPSSIVKDVLVTEEITITNGNRDPTSSASTLQCGVRIFRFRGTQTFSRLVATADAFSTGHIQLVQSYAQLSQKTLKPGERFDVYVDDASGADFIVPHGFSIAASGVDCVAHDPNDELEMRISSDAVPNFMMITSSANAFGARIVRSGELPLINTPFVTPLVYRQDGMAIQRYSFLYEVPGQQSPPNEGYITFAWQRGTLLEVSVRSLVPALGARQSSKIYPSIIAVCAATFTF